MKGDEAMAGLETMILAFGILLFGVSALFLVIRVTLTKLDLQSLANAAARQSASTLQVSATTASDRFGDRVLISEVGSAVGCSTISATAQTTFTWLSWFPLHTLDTFSISAQAISPTDAYQTPTFGGGFGCASSGLS